MKARLSYLSLTFFMSLWLSPAMAAPLVFLTEPPSGTAAAPFVLITQDDSRTMGNEWIVFYMDAEEVGVDRLFPIMNPTTDDANKRVMSFKHEGSGAYKKLRDPTQNKIYYDPTKTYAPWKNPDGSSYPQASLTCALYDPKNSSQCLPLFIEKSVHAKWCKDEGCKNDKEESQPFYPATYYNGNTEVRIDPVRDSKQAQNFANWFTYHRSRELVAKAAFGSTLQSFPSAFQVGYTNIHKSDGIPIVEVNPFNAAQKSAVYNALYAPGRQGQTPTRHTLYATGMYFKNKPTTSTCQRYFNILMSDGLWSDDEKQYYDSVVEDRSDEYMAPGTNKSRSVAYYQDMLRIGDIDSTTQVLPDRTTQSAVFPYKDNIVGASNIRPTLADIAMYWWANPIKGAAGTVSPTVDDPATWQHLVNFTISFGVNPSIFPGGISRPPVGWPSPFTEDAVGEDEESAPYDGRYHFKKNCYSPKDNKLYEDNNCKSDKEIKFSLARVYDLWHAAVNSRGKFFVATDTSSLVDSIQTILRSMAAASGSGGSISLNTNSLSTAGGKYVYQASYDGSNWSGDLLAYAINPTTGMPTTTVAWRASTQVPAALNRVIVTTNATGPNGVPFRWGDLAPTQQLALLGTANTPTGPSRTAGDDLVNYLRGDNRYTVPVGPFRPRVKPLGDIIHSSPLYVGAPPFKYADTSYNNFVMNNRTRSPMIYVGSNDGMLHGFDATSSSATAGTEKFAYIPGRLLNTMRNLSDPTYKHRYYVNGSPIAGDVQFTDGSWHTVIVGTLGFGGQSVFAIDVTNPANFSNETNAKKQVLWELTDETQPELGYTFSRPSIVKLNSGKWGVIFGNGYNSTEANATDTNPSTTGHAVLFIVDIETGRVIRTLDTMAGTVANPNGLSTPAVIDKNGDSAADYVYAGDLQGNLWKFDISSTNPTDWKVASTTTGVAPTPLFKTSGQPITTAPEIGLHPTGNGVMVYFGTGKYLEVTDPNDVTSANSFYGIWDDSTRLGLTRAQLQAQTIVSESSNKRVTSNQTFIWGGATGKMGWYLDLYAGTPKGERVIFAPVLDQKRILFTTLIPEVSADPCIAANGSGWVMELDAATGARPATPVLDINNDNQLNNSDLVAIGGGNAAPSGLKSTIGIPSAPSIINVSSTQNRIIFGGSDGKLQSILAARDPTDTGRQSWRQLVYNQYGEPDTLTLLALLEPEEPLVLKS